MTVEDNRKSEDRKFLKDIKVGECFDNGFGEIVVRTDEVFGGEIMGLNVRNGMLFSYKNNATVKPVTAKVVIEE